MREQRLGLVNHNSRSTVNIVRGRELDTQLLSLFVLHQDPKTQQKQLMTPSASSSSQQEQRQFQLIVIILVIVGSAQCTVLDIRFVLTLQTIPQILINQIFSQMIRWKGYQWYLQMMTTVTLMLMMLW
jgi:hypothetical protein